MQVLSVMVIPQASRENVEELSLFHYKVRVTAPATKGKANKAMLKTLARHLGVRTSDLVLTRGEQTQQKTVLCMEDISSPLQKRKVGVK